MRYYLHSRSNVLAYDKNGFTIGYNENQHEFIMDMNCSNMKECLTRLQYELTEIVKSVGGKNLRWARYNGWANQPKVITFNSDNIDLMEKKFSEVSLNGEKADYYFFLKEKDWK